MKGRSSSAMLLWIISIALAACSVKEDRSECPCCLMFDFSGVDCDITPIAEVSVVSADGFLFNDRVPSDTAQYSVLVPKQLLAVNVYDGDEGMYAAGGGLTIPLGSQCPPVLAYWETIDARAESALCSPVLHKNYCNLTIILRTDGSEGWDGSSAAGGGTGSAGGGTGSAGGGTGSAGNPFSFKVTGTVNGYDIYGTPSDGDFIFLPEMVSGDSAGGSPNDVSGWVSEARIPRQKDGSLRLEIMEEGKTLRTFALGEMILESGYDWSAPDLEDIEVEIDYSKIDVVFNISGWDSEYSFEITI